LESRPSIRIAIFASGKGSNARALAAYFADRNSAEVALLVSNKATSGVFQQAEEQGIPVVLLDRNQAKDGGYLIELMKQHEIDLIVLAGYLKLIPARLTQAMERRILNIHPSLLPAYGGKGMYGGRVHEAVLAAGDEKSGITIHYVNEVYDQGEILFQASVKVQPDWSASDLQQAIHSLEHQHFPKVVEKVCLDLYSPADKS